MDLHVTQGILYVVPISADEKNQLVGLCISSQRLSQRVQRPLKLAGEAQMNPDILVPLVYALVIKT